MTGIGASDSLGEYFVIQSRPMIHSISDYHQYFGQRKEISSVWEHYKKREQHSSMEYTDFLPG